MNTELTAVSLNRTNSADSDLLDPEQAAAYLTREGRISVRTSRALPAQAPEPIATGRPIRGLGIVIFPLEVSH